MGGLLHPASHLITPHVYVLLVSACLLFFTELPKGPLLEGPVTTSPRSRSEKNVADAKLEKTSLSADVFLGVPFVTGPSLRYFSWPFFGHTVASHLASGGPDPSKGTFAGRRSFM